MKTIPSFTIDHEILTRGIYISRIDDDITTYDIRMREPNRQTVMDNASLHTIEHLFATYVRNSEYAGNIIYFGPMGCRTGCYFLTRGLENDKSIKLIQDAFNFIKNFNGEIPGAAPRECGNWSDHSLSGAKKEATDFLSVIGNWTENDLKYPG